MERTLRKACGLGLGLVLVVSFSIQVCAQKNSPPQSTAPLVPAPQGVAYSPETNKLFVGSCEGSKVNGAAAHKTKFSTLVRHVPYAMVHSPQS
jgi:hypothetical protein